MVSNIKPKMELFYIKLLYTSQFIYFTMSAPQHPEINDQFSSTTFEAEPQKLTIQSENSTNIILQTTTTSTTTEVSNLKFNTENPKSKDNRKYFDPYKEVKDIETRPSLIMTVYQTLTKPIEKFISTPKVNFVLRNVGTCLVNGAMEIIAYYFPAPLIPLIASAAGMVIPFEPVVMLKEKMPVTSYRRAFKKAVNSFMNTFDGYKPDMYDDDPYMTRRFNRRFMNEISGENKKRNE